MDEKQKNEDINPFIKSDLEVMTKHFMQVFELLASQLGSKSTPESNSSTPHDEGETNGETIFSKIGPYKGHHELKNQSGPEITKILASK